MNLIRAGTLLLVLLLSVAVPASASEGDAQDDFRVCTATCEHNGCLPSELRRWCPEAGDPHAIGGRCSIACAPNAPDYRQPLALSLTQWDCSADCSYHCMWAIERRRAAAGEGPVYKYYGKWPFTRVLGAQEISSVLFSVANLAAHVSGLRRYAAAVRAHAGSGKGAAAAAAAAGGTAGYPYAWAWFLYGAASINAWVWSSVFHVRDTRLTERLDYFSADILVAAGLVVAVTRAARLTRPLPAVLVAMVVASGLLWHVRYMAFVKFDYGYNMKLCIGLGVTTAVTWVAWALLTKHPGRRRLVQFIAAVHVAMALEVLDFPPLFKLLDAHALWHAATAPLTPLWYDFVISDVAWVAGGGGGSGGPDSSGGIGSAGGGGGGGGDTGSSGEGAAARTSPSPPGGGRRRAVTGTGDQGKRVL